MLAWGKTTEQSEQWLCKAVAAWLFLRIFAVKGWIPFHINIYCAIMNMNRAECAAVIREDIARLNEGECYEGNSAGRRFGY